MKDIVAQVHVATHPILNNIAKVFRAFDLAENSKVEYETLAAKMCSIGSRISQTREIAVANEVLDQHEVTIRDHEQQHAYGRELIDRNLQQVDELHHQLLGHGLARDALSMSLLQIAKQLISIVHAGLDNCPQGRLVGPIPIRDIIWHGRNQAIHFEEGKMKAPVVKCFEELERVFGSKFQLTQSPVRSLAPEVIKLLEWFDIASFEKDMRSLVT